MSLETACSAIDWLKSVGCRVISLMGGEPLLRKDFVLEVIRYGAENGLFMYLHTNGYLMDKSFIDEAGRAASPRSIWRWIALSRERVCRRRSWVLNLSSATWSNSRKSTDTLFFSTSTSAATT